MDEHQAASALESHVRCVRQEASIGAEIMGEISGLG